MDVLIGNLNCLIQTVTDVEITCNLGENAAGNYPVLVQTTSSGFSNKDIIFQYELKVDSISNTEGNKKIFEKKKTKNLLKNFSFFSGSTAGGLNLIIKGGGFSDLTKVSICNNSCQIIQGNYSSLTCKV